MIFDPDLCRKYTDLSEEEILFLGSFEPKLQELADTEQADVFIDCCSTSGKSAVVVAEAKPHTVPSAYEMIILGMIIRWENEPAVERTFRVGLPTTGMMSVFSPENQRVVQSVYPIVFKEKVIATLIYEKAISVEKKDSAARKAASAGCSSRILDNIFDAVLITNKEGCVISCNQRAGELLEELGYVDDPNGMRIENLWDTKYVVQSAAGTELIRVSNHVFEGKWTSLKDGDMDRMYTVKDVTELIRWQTEYKKSVIARRELKHRIKNSLELLYSIFEKKRENIGDPGACRAYEEAVIRISSVLVTLDDMGAEEDDGMLSLKEAIFFLCRDISFTYNCHNIHITGDDITIEGKKASVICMIVSELIYNSLKYAWGGKETGNIRVTLVKDVLNNTIVVEDDGSGIPEETRKGAIGLDLVRTLAAERLQGDVRIITGHSGTRVEVDFI
ncbi:MAG: sensor histidine kinase [Lachnospiraceae bacterium]|nr:sensor histidine kinase [Lachnospiraceae bacterium]